jgi:hypothetical protein
MTYTIRDKTTGRRETLGAHTVLARDYDTVKGAKIALSAYVRRLQKKMEQQIASDDYYDRINSGWSQLELVRIRENVEVVETEVYLRECPTIRVQSLRGPWLTISVDTPACLDPSTETYWSM